MNKRQVVAESVGEAIKEEAANIVEEIPVVGKALSKAVKVVQKVNEKANEKMKGMDPDMGKPPRFMQCVKFVCKRNKVISDQQRCEIKLILQKDYESMEKESLADIEHFIDTYVAGEVRTECSEDCIIDEGYLWIHLDEFEQFLYDGECLQKTMNALNTLLREELFERFEAWGHDEDYRYN